MCDREDTKRFPSLSTPILFSLSTNMHSFGPICKWSDLHLGDVWFVSVICFLIYLKINLSKEASALILALFVLLHSDYWRRRRIVCQSRTSWDSLADSQMQLRSSGCGVFSHLTSSGAAFLRLSALGTPQHPEPC